MTSGNDLVDRLRRAAALLDLGRAGEAAALASQAVATHSFDPEAWLVLARCFAALDEPVRALDAANRALGLDPTNADAHLVASRVLATLKWHAEAVRAGQQAVRLAPLSPWAHANLAIALAQSGGGADLFGLRRPAHLRAASAHARQAIELAPISTAGHFASGFVAARSSHPRRARAHYHRVLAIDPQNAQAQNNLAVLDLNRGRVSRSGTGFARTLATDPRLGLARRNLRAALHRQLVLLHAVAWLIYVCFSAIASNPASGPFALAWTPKCTVAAAMSGAYAIGTFGVYLRMDKRVREFGRAMFADSWILKSVAAVDVVMAVCFTLSLLTRGSTASPVFLVGFLGIPASYVGLACDVQLSRRSAI